MTRRLEILEELDVKINDAVLSANLYLNLGELGEL